MKMQRKILPAIALIILATTFIAIRMPLASADLQLALGLSITSTANVVDYDNGVYAIGTTAGDLYVVSNGGQYTVTSLAAGSINDVRIEHPFIAVAAGDTVIELQLAGLAPTELWRIVVPGFWGGRAVSVDVSEDGNYVAYLSRYDSVGVISGGSIIASYSISGSWIAHWLDATGDMEYIAITAEVGPNYGGVNTGVELYSFDGASVQRIWGRILVYNYETTEVRVSEAKDYVAVATSSGIYMNLLDFGTGDLLWQYTTTNQEQFACDGDDDLNYVIGGTQAWSPPYRYFVLKNLGTTGYQLMVEGEMVGGVNDLDSTPDASYFAFGSDAGEVILLGRTGDTVATLFTTSGLPRIDAIEIGSDSPLHSLLVGGDNFINLYVQQQQYYLTVKTDPSGAAVIGGEGWYDTPATLSAPLVSGKYSFRFWFVDGVYQGKANVITVPMSAPHTAIAYYGLTVGGEWAPISTVQLVTPWIVLVFLAISLAAAGSHRLLKKRW